jgi:pimeloyl-ACP methyl ester carboxylesterase
MKVPALCLLLCGFLGTIKGQEAVYFYAGDSVKIRGDLYLHGYNLPFIILCHQEGSNRSEFYDIAPRLLNLNYNCLAIDLRAGGTVSFTDNETARKALSGNRPVQMIDALPDILAAIDYVKGFNPRPVILFGSSFSASLCLLAAMGNPRVLAVVAFSPGEYFQPRINMAARMGKMDKPVFVGTTQPEFEYLKKMTSGIPEEDITLFKPEKGIGIHGTRALTSGEATRDEYWFALMMFFKKLI